MRTEFGPTLEKWLISFFFAQDIPRGLLYWADSGLRTVSRAAFDGQHRKTVVESNGYLDQPFGLAIFEVRYITIHERPRFIFITVTKHTSDPLYHIHILCIFNVLWKY